VKADDLSLPKTARVRLGEVFEAFETNPKSRVGRVITYRDRYSPPRESLGEAASRLVRRQFGEEIDAADADTKTFCVTAPVQHVMYLVMGSFAYLQYLDSSGGLPVETSLRFAEEVNEIVRADGFPMYFDEAKNGWTFTVSSDAEALRRALLQDPADAAACKQGDPQVEMVVSTVQTALTVSAPRPGSR
jgi:hypothetical protein